MDLVSYRTASGLVRGGARCPEESARPESGRVQCHNCRFAAQCVPGTLSTAEVQQFERGVQRCRPLGVGEHLFRAGDPFRSIFAIQAGSCKTYMVDSAGREHVLSFHFGGEVIGIDAMYPGRHPSNCVALSDSKVCILPYKTLTALAHEIPDVQLQILRLFSREILGNSALAGDFSAEERLATFLVMVAARLSQHRGRYQHTDHESTVTDLDLAMSRQDIASYLRLAPETLSRILARFQKTGLVRADRKHITLLDLGGLAELAACMNPYARYGRRREPR